MADKEGLYCVDCGAGPFNREEAALNVPSPRVALVAQMAATLHAGALANANPQAISSMPDDLVSLARTILTEAERQEGQ